MKKTKRLFIRNWEELSKIPNESKTHILKIDLDRCCGWLYAKNKKQYNTQLSFMRQIQNQDVYLSTHTFYNTQYKHSSKKLRACGFNVELANWDKV